MRRVVLPLMLAVVLLLLTPLAASAESPLARVQAPKGLNFRQAPGLDAPILFGLYDGEMVSLLDGLDTPIYEDGIRWVEVGVYRWGYWYTGYVAFAYLDQYGAYGGYEEPAGGWSGPDGLKVTASALNLRYGPGLWHHIGRIVPYGTILQPTGAGTVAADGYVWQQVQTGGGLWAANSYLTPLP
ncbi:MAG: SH3 domain-containing protein [Anaerolineales bacterium]